MKEVGLEEEASGIFQGDNAIYGHSRLRSLGQRGLDSFFQ
jgi:hypothetical protein